MHLAFPHQGICRLAALQDDLICLPSKVASGMGNLGPLVLCTRVTNSLLLLDPSTLRGSHVDVNAYWRLPYKPLLTSRQMVEYVVLDIEPLGNQTKHYAMAEAQVAGARLARSSLCVWDTSF